MTAGLVATFAVAVLPACGRARPPTTSVAAHPASATLADRVLALLPDGAQVVVELDLARLRQNPVVGALVTTALTGGALDRLPGGSPRPEPSAAEPASPLTHADLVVLASYGLGTSQAATVTIVSTPDPVPNSVALGDHLVALGPPEWTAQLEARAALSGLSRSAGGVTAAPARELVASAELLALRDHALPAGAPGSSVRITARLSFDARIALARQAGLDAPPSRISIWADVVDDLAVVIDADAADPGDRKTRHPTKKLEASVTSLLTGLAAEPQLQALGLPSSLTGARIIARGTWVRTIIAIGPAHLRRVVARATSLFEGKP